MSTVRPQDGPLTFVEIVLHPHQRMSNQPPRTEPAREEEDPLPEQERNMLYVNDNHIV